MEGAAHTPPSNSPTLPLTCFFTLGGRNLKPHVRAVIAAIALADSHSRKVSGVYSYSGEGHISIDAEVYGDQIKAWDNSKGSAIEGNFPDLFHYGESAHIEIKRVQSGRYEGYDYGTGRSRRRPQHD